jgi:hypothetical protein
MVGARWMLGDAGALCLHAGHLAAPCWGTPSLSVLVTLAWRLDMAITQPILPVRPA